MRSEGRGAQLIKRPNTPFYKKGYDSADFFCRTCTAMASNKVKKVIKGYGDAISHNIFNPDTCLYGSMLKIVNSKL